MRRVWIAAVALSLFACAPVLAATGGDKDSPPASKTAAPASNAAPKASTPSTATPSTTAAAKAEPVVPTSELQKLQDLIRAQQDELAAQREALENQEKQIEELQGKAQSVIPSSMPPQASSVSAMPMASPTPAPNRNESSSSSAVLSTNPSMVGKLPSSKAEANALGKDPAQAGSEPKLGPIATQDFKIGVTFFGDWSDYNSTGYGMQFMDTPTEQLPPGNDGFNTFEVNRAYVTFMFTPNEHVALRVTPDIYRQADGSYSFRLKYGYVDFQKIFGDGAFKNDKLTFGQTQQPLTDWEEGLSGYRYTALTPWNFVSLSSTWVGGKLHGPIEFNGKEYLDYDFGVFNTASFHAVETDENKQFMVRGTFYPLGTTSDRTGLGVTFFNDFGYKTALPSAPQTSLDRLAVIGFYQTHNKADQIAFEYDWGHNAFGTSNLFNGAGAPSGAYLAFGTEAGTILTGDTHQRGFALFGHARLGHSPFSAFGLWQYFQPNTDFDFKGAGFSADPIDWSRTVGGISYSVTKQFDIAFGDENFHWLHSQGIATGGDTNGIVIWTQFNY
jgi:hypothetical protein